ncbi:hypothetical protein XMIN_28 [Xanthomonas citri pv. mangiferaeindicae LMG 941]|nr:hypothetical protein XMIN_28 [Xanthomonas citri pv. mangiferaeindicae LMG 941]
MLASNNKGPDTHNKDVRQAVRVAVQRGAGWKAGMESPCSTVRDAVVRESAKKRITGGWK